MGTAEINSDSDSKLHDGEELINDNPIEEVRLTVPITDDPTQPVLTFRTWFLGITSCALLAFVNQFFGFRTNQLGVGSVVVQILVLPIGKIMAATLPTRSIRVAFTSFSLNPGPFNMKEHALITIFASCGVGGVYAVHIVTSLRAFYHRKVDPVAALLLVQTTQLLGYGWAGIFRRFLVDSPYMWWPTNLVQVSMFRALHEKDKREKRGLTRLQFFAIVCVTSFAYYTVPGYLFPSLSTISIVCLIWKNSVTAQQIGSGLNGLGVGSFGLDWSTVAAFLGTPLATPWFTIVNIVAGFCAVIYLILPILYWTDTYNAKKFPILSSKTFDRDGQRYNITRILNDKLEIDLVKYNNYSQLHLSVFFAIAYGLSFAAIASTISHVGLFEGKTIWNSWKKTTAALKDNCNDVHTRLMKKNYPVVPEWWFISILVISLALALFAIEGFGNTLQLRYWGLLLACGIAFVFTLPIGIIQATTNQQIGLNVITELIIGYIYPGKPIANVAFKTYGYMSMVQALNFIQDFKLGHYMKIPPKAMFLVQLVGTLVATSVYFGTSWWLLSTIPSICNIDELPKGSPWTCPGDNVFYSASIIWGVIGPLRMFGKLGVYPQMNWFFLIGFLAPLPGWYFSRKFPEKKWIRLINTPLILSATSYLPPAKPVHYLSWAAVGFVFNFYIYRRYKGWWARHNYILSAALDSGVAFMAIVLYFSLQAKDIYGVDWWGLESDDHCPLATCPTAPGVESKSCPAFH